MSSSHEHPDSAFSWKIPEWRVFCPGAVIIRFSICMYGVPYRKHTELLLINAGFLKPLGRRCDHDYPHARLEGSLTIQAAEYPQPFCQELARLTCAHFELQGPVPLTDLDPFSREPS